MQAREGEEGADHGDAQTAAEVHDEEGRDEEQAEELNPVGTLEEGLLRRGERVARSAPDPSQERRAADPEFVGDLLLRALALTASGLEVEHLGAANRAGRLPGGTWGVRSDRELGRFRGHGSTRGVGLVFATLLLPRFGPCLQPSPGALAPSPRVEVRACFKINYASTACALAGWMV